MNAPIVSPQNTASRAAGVADPTFLGVMRLLAGAPQVSQRKVASSLGISLGKANYCLRALIAKGFVKAENYRKSSHKLGYLYLLTPSGMAAKAALTRHFLARKVKEYEALRSEIAALRRENEHLTRDTFVPRRGKAAASASSN